MGTHDECIGAQGVPLTPGRSLAVDKRIHIYGTPIWIDAELPIESEKPETKFRHLLFAQDTGSAIVGPARADIYFGHGEEISHIAGRIKQNGQFVMLVAAKRGYQWHGGRPTNVPLPKPRPAMIVTAAARSATETTSSVTLWHLPAAAPLISMRLRRRQAASCSFRGRSACCGPPMHQIRSPRCANPVNPADDGASVSDNRSGRNPLPARNRRQYRRQRWTGKHPPQRRR